MDKDAEKVIHALFTQSDNIYSLLWWNASEANLINARSFIINGKDSIPIFATETEARSQVEGSGYEANLVGVKPGLLADVLQSMEYAILNPGGPRPIQFKTCFLKQYIEKKW